MFQETPKPHFRLKGSSQKTLKVTNPNTLEVLGEIPLIDSTHIQEISELMSLGTKKLKSISPHTRSQWLKNLAQEIESHKEKLAHLIALEGGKPLKDARVEVQRACITLNLCAQEALIEELPSPDLSSSPQGSNKKIKTLREPIGPVLVLSAFNHPLNLLAHQVGSALAAGNSVCFKPSPSTPYCAEWLADTLKKIGVDESIALLIHADVAEIEKLVAHPIFQYVSFVGSAGVGWSLRAKLAPGTRLALEHGGVATAIVCADAELEKAAQSLCKGAFYHAGQVCISTQRILVHEKVFDAFLDHFKRISSQLKVADAREESSDVGPLIRVQVKEKLEAWITEAQSLGAKIALSSQSALPQFMNPTILTHVPVEAKLMKEEAFGPVVCVNPYKDIQECFQLIEESPYHFSASIFSQKKDLIEKAQREMACMSLVINEHTAWRVDAMAFGGHRQSGLGMGGVHWAVSDQTRLKQIIY